MNSAARVVNSSACSGSTVARRAAIASGHRRVGAAVPDPRVVGGFGETPGFVYRDHLRSVLAHGTPPTSILRRILLG